MGGVRGVRWMEIKNMVWGHGRRNEVGFEA